MNTRISILFVLFAISTQSLSYELGGPTFDPVHQALTIIALECLDESTESAPANCLPLIQNCLNNNAEGESIKRCVADETSAKLFLGKYTDKQLAFATKWPDDPTNESGYLQGAKFIKKMIDECAKLLLSGKGLNIMDGLLCNTHFGGFQFWHAQASSASETGKQTRSKILDWAKFNYEVAIGKIEPDKNYCDHFDDSPSSISKLMKPDNYKYCVERLFWGWVPASLVAPYPAYEIGTLYGMKCGNPFQSKRCREKRRFNPSERADKTILSATGALLHLIHDSFSQSHSERGICHAANDIVAKKPISKIECEPIKMFTNYAQYNPATNIVNDQNDHKKSDSWPVLANSCLNIDRISDDPITAGAKILWHISQRSPWSEVKKDLNLVFNPVKAPSSGPGVCYQ